MISKSSEVFKKYTDEATFARIVPFATVCDMWKSRVAEFGGSVAIEDDGNKYTFAEVEADAARLRALIAGEAKGTRVGVIAANSYDFVVAYIAAVTAGYTAALLPAHLPAEAVFGCAMMFGLKKIIFGAGMEEKTAVVASQRPDVSLVSASARAECGAPIAEVEGSDGCAIVFTGGTTGKSKGALLSHRAVMEGTVNGCYGYKDVFAQRYLLVLPLTHVFGLIRNLMTSLYTGSDLFICRNNKDMFRDCAAFRPTILVMVPALAEMALTLSKKFGRNMMGDALKTIICGAAPVAPYLVAEYDKLGVNLCPGYGLTESANLVSGNPESVSKPESVGIPFPNQELRIVNGELWLKGDNMMDGYVGAQESGAYEDGFFKTGDLARFDEDGYLYITGRTKEIIVLPSGENVSPAEVEFRFNALDCVQDSQVFEAIADGGAHILALEVVPRATMMTDLSPEERKAKIVEACEKVNAELPSFERVSRITVRDSDFERTPAMKIIRYKLDK